MARSSQDGEIEADDAWSSMPNRVSSFQHFPRSEEFSAARLARAGFYFTGQADKVRCFSCHATVEDWTERMPHWRDISKHLPTASSSAVLMVWEPPTSFKALLTMKRLKPWSSSSAREGWWIRLFIRLCHTWRVRKLGWIPLVSGLQTLQFNPKTWQQQGCITWDQMTPLGASVVGSSWQDGSQAMKPGVNMQSTTQTASSSWATMWAMCRWQHLDPGWTVRELLWRLLRGVLKPSEAYSIP